MKIIALVLISVIILSGCTEEHLNIIDQERNSAKSFCQSRNGDLWSWDYDFELSDSTFVLEGITCKLIRNDKIEYVEYEMFNGDLYERRSF